MNRATAFCLFVLVSCRPDPTLASGNETPVSLPKAVHGTIVVAISTKDGFVLAGDSRGSVGCMPVAGEFEKVFSVGKRSGIVVAGLIQSEDSTEELKDSVATWLHDLDQPGTQFGAPDIVRSFVSDIRDELFLLDPSVPVGTPVAAASAVTVDELGGSEWITLILDPVVQTHRGGIQILTAKVEKFVVPPASKVQALGSGSGVVERLTSLEQPTPTIPYSEEPVLRKYYSLKKSNNLSDLTLQDGEALARLFVAAAIDWGSTEPCAGLGGSIDVLAITKAGTEWIQRKTEVVPSTPKWGLRISHQELRGKLDWLPGVEWFRDTVPDGGTITFDGDGDVHVVSPSFAGTCDFVIGEYAEQRRPTTTSRLKQVFRPSCGIYVLSGSTRRKVSDPTQRDRIAKPKPESHTLYRCLTNREIKSAVEQTVDKSGLEVQNYQAHQSEREYAEMAPKMPPIRKDDALQWLKDELLDEDERNQLDSDFYSQILPISDALREEIRHRLNQPPVEHRRVPTPNSKCWGRPFWEACENAEELELLAAKLPDSSQAQTDCGQEP